MANQQQQQQFIMNFDTELTVVLPANSENQSRRVKHKDN